MTILSGISGRGAIALAGGAAWKARLVAPPRSSKAFPFIDPEALVSGDRAEKDGRNFFLFLPGLLREFVKEARNPSVGNEFLSISI